MQKLNQIIEILSQKKRIAIPALTLVFILISLVLVREIKSLYIKPKPYNKIRIQHLKKITHQAEKIAKTKNTRGNFLKQALAAHGLDEEQSKVYFQKIDTIVHDIQKQISKQKLPDEQKAKYAFDYLWKNVIKSTLLMERYKITYLLDKGYGNCLSVVATYIIVLNKLGIDYQLYSLSTHVYVMINNIDIEVTAKDGFDKKNRKGQLLTKSLIDESHLVASFISWAAGEAIRSREYKFAIKLYEIAEKVQPEEHTIYGGKAHAYWKWGDECLISHWKFKLAEENHKKELKKCPYSIDSQLRYADFMIHIGKHEKAKHLLQKAYELTKKQDMLEDITYKKIFKKLSRFVDWKPE